MGRTPRSLRRDTSSPSKAAPPPAKAPAPKGGLGADLRARCVSLGMTPLHVGALAGHIEVGAMLLKAGAPPAARDDSKRTPADWAASRGNRELARLITGHPSAGAR